MSVVNIQRDSIFVEPDSAVYSWSTAAAMNIDPLFNGPAAVNSKYVSVSKTRSGVHTQAIGEVVCIGAYFEPINLEKKPFRVKAGFDCSWDPTETDGVIIVGYGPASPTGSDDTISGARFLPFGKSDFDGCIIVEPEPVGDTYDGRPIAIGLGIVANGAVTATLSSGFISIQDLSKAPPAFAQSVG